MVVPLPVYTLYSWSSTDCSATKVFLTARFIYLGQNFVAESSNRRRPNNSSHLVFFFFILYFLPFFPLSPQAFNLYFYRASLGNF
ncbi:hypothetical protein BDF20DRAFT_889674, partial [Mycotypha africana]|uniref:uncharacterized protein n=1 Tax=Mycotypha africana TaxID=64632 RepID=UPI002300D354